MKQRQDRGKKEQNNEIKEKRRFGKYEAKLNERNKKRKVK